MSDELRSYEPSARERAKALIAQLLGDTRGANEWADKLVKPLDYTPGVSNLLSANDAGRDVAAGNYGSAALDTVGAIGGGLSKAMLIGAGAKLKNIPGLVPEFREMLDGVRRAEIPANVEPIQGLSPTKLGQLLDVPDAPGVPAANVLRADKHFKLYPELTNMNVTLPPGGKFTDSPYSVHYRPGYNMTDHNLWIDGEKFAKLPDQQRRFELARALQQSVANVEKWPAGLVSSSLRPSPEALQRTGAAYADIAKSLEAGVSPDDILASASQAGAERYAVARHAVETLQTPEAIRRVAGEINDGALPITRKDFLQFQKKGYPLPPHAIPAERSGKPRMYAGYPEYGSDDATFDHVMRARATLGPRLYTEAIADNAARRDVNKILREQPFDETMNILPSQSIMRISR